MGRFPLKDKAERRAARSESNVLPHVIFLNRYFHPDHSATSQMLSDLAFALAARGLRISVITSRQRYSYQPMRPCSQLRKHLTKALGQSLTANVTEFRALPQRQYR
jgi:hypothetical protein